MLETKMNFKRKKDVGNSEKNLDYIERNSHLGNFDASTLRASRHDGSLSASIAEKTLGNLVEDSVPLYAVSLGDPDDNITKQAEILFHKVFKNRKIHSFHWIRCNEGITNKLFKCEMSYSEEEKEKGEEILLLAVLVKVYGKKSELFINRKQEFCVSAEIQAANLVIIL
jgi:hypothetical protein